MVSLATRDLRGASNLLMVILLGAFCKKVCPTITVTSFFVRPQNSLLVTIFTIFDHMQRYRVLDVEESKAEES